MLVIALNIFIEILTKITFNLKLANDSNHKVILHKIKTIRYICTNITNIMKRKARAIICIGILILTMAFITKEFIPRGEYVLEYPKNFGNRYIIPADNQMRKEVVYLGRMLFYEPLLSANNKISCVSCHQQRLAFTDGKRLSIGVSGKTTKRNSMSLANILWVRQLFWDGRASSLEEQAMGPLTHPDEMAQSLAVSCQKLEKTRLYPTLFMAVFHTKKITPELITKSIAQFERTLISANAKYDQYLAGTISLNHQESNGLKLFSSLPQPENGVRGAGCIQCHGGAKTYIELFHNNGLPIDEMDLGRFEITQNIIDKARFRVPTLRNIALTAPYMHDGRFKTLEEVLDHYNDHIENVPNLSPFLKNNSNEKNGKNLALTVQEKQDLIAFLHTLTDSSFIQNPAFANPHKTINP